MPALPLGELSTAEEDSSLIWRGGILPLSLPLIRQTAEAWWDAVCLSMCHLFSPTNPDLFSLLKQKTWQLRLQSSSVNQWLRNWKGR